MAAVNIRKVAKRFDAVTVMQDIDLDVADGEFIVLVGASGCGKSTLLRMIAGLEPITAGEIAIGGRRVNELEPRERDVAMVFQSYALYPHLDVRENMSFALRLRKRPPAEIDRQVDATAATLGLEALLERRPRALSGGQRQRVAMGRAIVRQPQAFLMDEPLSNLDAKLRVEMRAEIARIQRDLNVTTVYVTHDQTEAMTMGDRVAVMRNGLLQQVAPPQVLYERPTNLFVAEFIGSPAMNLIQADLATEDGATWVRFAEHRLRLDGSSLQRRPALSRFQGRPVVVGIRPEDIEDAAVLGDTSEDQRISVVCDIREDMGSEVYMHFNVAGVAVTTKEVVEALVVDAREDAETRQAAERARGAGVSFVARLHRDTEARERRPLELAVDVARLHFFDPETGLAIDEE
jgi:multiple sugar transport system ATP-binding protein